MRQTTDTAEMRIPFATAEQMAAVDQAMFESCGLDVLQIMETAGRMVAVMARHMLGDALIGASVVSVCGSGGNGGDGLVAARHLASWGAKSSVVLSRYPDEDSIAARQLEAVRRCRIPAICAKQSSLIGLEGDLLIDGLLGFGGKRAPLGVTADLIRMINQTHGPVLSIDSPSGLNATTGKVFDPCVVADATLTLALPKTGFRHQSARNMTGQIWVADIGVPLPAYEQAELTVDFNWQTDITYLAF